MAGAKTSTLQKIMKKFRMESQQEHDEIMQKRMRQRSSMRNQSLEPKPPDSVQYKPSRHKWSEEEEAGRGELHFKQSASTWSRPHQSSLTHKSVDLYSNYKHDNNVQLYAFSGKSNYLEWERTMDKWLCYYRIPKKDALTYAMSQIKGSAYKWFLQEEDDRRYYKEPSIRTWESLKLALRSKYASKGHTYLQSPEKKDTSPASFLSEKSETKMTDLEKAIRKSILRAFKDVVEQLKREKAAHQTVEAQSHEPVTIVSELKDKPEAVVLVQESRTESSSFLSQETQGNTQTAISDYCSNICTLGKQITSEEPKNHENGNNTYEQEEVSDCLPWLKGQEETNLLRN